MIDSYRDKFKRPSDLFQWCLEKIEHDESGVNYRYCFPAYYQSTGSVDYLWKQYDRRLIELINNMRPGLKVLEIGCGFGHDLHWCALHGAEATGLDVKSEMIALSRRLTPRIEKNINHHLDVTIKRQNLLDLDEGGKFDFIYMKDTLHHLEPRDECVRKIASLLAPKGQLLIVEPNAWNPLIQLSMFRIRGFNTIITKVDSSTGEVFTYGNERLLTGGTMLKLFREVGVAGKVRSFRILPTSLTKYQSLSKLAGLLENANIEKFFPILPIHTVFYGERT